MLGPLFPLFCLLFNDPRHPLPPQRTYILNDPFLSLTKLQKWVIWASVTLMLQLGTCCNGVKSYLKITDFGVCSVEEPRLVGCIAWHIQIKGLRFKGVSLIFKAAKLLNFTELASNLKFTRFFFIQQAKLDPRKFFLSLTLINKFTGNVIKYQPRRKK